MRSERKTYRATFKDDHSSVTFITFAYSLEEAQQKLKALYPEIDMSLLEELL